MSKELQRPKTGCLIRLEQLQASKSVNPQQEAVAYKSSSTRAASAPAALMAPPTALQRRRGLDQMWLAGLRLQVYDLCYLWRLGSTPRA